MEEGRRSVDTSSDYVVKSRSSTGCLVVRKKRQMTEISESVSSDELLVPGRRSGRGCNGLSGSVQGSGDLGIKVGGERTRLDVFEFGEYDGDNVDDGHDSVGVVREREYDTRSSRRDAFKKHYPIRVQGKNGVLKVMVNKKNNTAGVREAVEDVVGRNGPVRSRDHTEPRVSDKGRSFSGAIRSPLELSESPPLKNGKSDLVVKLDNAEAPNAYRKSMTSKKIKVQDTDSKESDTSLKFRQKSGEVDSAVKGTGKLTSNQPIPTKGSDGKVKRGTGTEKQKVREKIRQMLLDAGWTMDYRPRRNRDYLDAVYISPSGTTYWSITKAYDTLLKQLNIDEENAKLADDDSQFAPLPDEFLNQLTRNTKKKMEKEKKKKRDGDSVRATLGRRSSSSMHDEESMVSGSRGEKHGSFIKVGGKTLRSRTKGANSASFNSKGQSSCRNIPGGSGKFVAHQGRKTKKLGRCTLLVRGSAVGQDSEADGFVSFTRKRTLLSWLIDCGTVQLSQKVLYMNRRRTKVMLEGWVTREGIHCGCCSKILTVSKFEIHAGSKLRQPFQNIWLESGVSLMECQVDAWNSQESVEQIAFHTMDVDGGDPNDDACGICGDGGGLICCDGCPSTFHLSCLDIEMLPPGDWHCPNCTCKFCGVAGHNLVEDDDTTMSPIFTCKLCAKKCHKACALENDDLSVDAGSSIACFCGRNCQELFGQRYLGVKHELEGGFSWSLIHRTETGMDATALGLPQRVESNAKLAVALSVMDECFLPIVDRRSGINIIRNVLYNSRSNFNRLNYGGFYAVILERNDEIISAASIRFHGTWLAEMPFIGTRRLYRRQGMCRRLFGAIESVLSSFKVERLVIPAISELMSTWAEVFGFTTLDKSLKQEVKSTNILGFPGVDMLQKHFCMLKKDEGLSTGSKVRESDQAVKNEVATTLVEYDSHGAGAESVYHDNADSEEVTKYSESHHPDIPHNGSSPVNNSADAAHEDKMFGSAVESGNCTSDISDMKKQGGEEKSHVIVDNVNSEIRYIKTENETRVQCPGVPLANDTDALSGSLDGSSECKVEGIVSADSEPGVLPLTSASGQKYL